MKVVFCLRQFRKEMYSKNPQNFTLNYKICIKRFFSFIENRCFPRQGGRKFAWLPSGKAVWAKGILQNTAAPKATTAKEAGKKEVRIAFLSFFVVFILAGRLQGWRTDMERLCIEWEMHKESIKKYAKLRKRK